MSTLHVRREWAEFKEMAPAANAALVAFGQAVTASGIEKDLLELMKLRASQINGCSFCAQYHLNIARTLGISQTKLDLIAVWRDAGVFSDREIAAFSWTESLTLIIEDGASEQAYTEVCAHFSATEVVHLTNAVANINAWNRIAIALRFSPPIPTPAQS